MKRKRNFNGIVQDAAILGVHRYHLYAVLSGRRQSPSLLKRYQQLSARKVDIVNQLTAEFSEQPASNAPVNCPETVSTVQSAPCQGGIQ